MKTILVTFLVFASIIFFSSTTFARVVTHNGDKYADTERRLDGFVDFVHPPGGEHINSLTISVDNLKSNLKL
ncbi:hypothetical protein L6164_005811 [Bauhinia variegata]|uniref:Uncharacterized protein n=2 Tax=Bauhinia variegata TaxID=167791 RepID=A0ACB9PS95_BAUVA|nr:hypothetical protein L6164_005808 [Bauhinia variegata]KAI4351442.1 hypothetical protein L6164_005811 [Bauhinia variegata]